MEILDNIRLLFRREKKPYLQLKAILGFYPRNIKLYQLALKHKSVAHFQREEQKMQGVMDNKSLNQRDLSLNNERLEYLGDAILGAVVADILYRHYGNKQEGFLTNLRSKIVCRKSLNQLAVKIGLDKLIQHTGAVTTGHNSFMNGNAFEAFFGAIYLDRGYAYCYRFMEQQVFKRHINVDNLSKQEENFKSSLIEWCQKYQYQFVFTQKEIREGNTPKFFSTLCIEGIVAGKGQGYSKKESDQDSAKDALRQIRKDKKFAARIKDAYKERKSALEADVAPDVASEVASDVADVASNVAPNTTSDTVSDIATNVAPNTVSDIAPDVVSKEQTIASENLGPKEVFSSNWD